MVPLPRASPVERDWRHPLTSISSPALEGHLVMNATPVVSMFYLDRQSISSVTLVVVAVSRAFRRVSAMHTCSHTSFADNPDPFLAGTLGKAWIEGVQSRNVMACESPMPCGPSSPTDITRPQA